MIGRDSSTEGVDQGALIRYCQSNNITLNGGFTDTRGVCAPLVNLFIEYYKENNTDITKFFALLRQVHQPGKASLQKVKNLVTQIRRFENSEGFINVPGTIYYNCILAYGTDNPKLRADINYILENLKASQVIHVTIGIIHSFAIVKKTINGILYYYLYDPNNPEEPKLQTSSTIYKEIQKVCNTLPGSFLFSNYNILNFNILDYNVNIADHLIKPLRLIENIKLTELLKAYDENKISLIIFLTNVIDLFKQDPKHAELIAAIRQFLTQETTNIKLLENKDVQYCSQASLVKLPNFGNFTLLHNAVFINDVCLVRLLVSMGVKDEVKTNGGRLAIHIALEKKRIAIFEHLMERKTFPINTLFSFSNALGLMGQTCYLNSKKSLLHIAVDVGDIEFIKLLVEKYNANPNHLDQKGKSSLTLASEKGYKDIWSYLLLQNVHPVAEVLASKEEEIEDADILFQQKNISRLIIYKKKFNISHFKNLCDYIVASDKLLVLNIHTVEISWTLNKDEINSMLEQALLKSRSLITVHLPSNFSLSPQVIQRLNVNRSKLDNDVKSHQFYPLLMFVQAEINRLKTIVVTNDERGKYKIQFLEQKLQEMFHDYKFLDFVTPDDILNYNDLGLALNMDRDLGFFASMHRRYMSPNTTAYNRVSEYFSSFQQKQSLDFDDKSLLNNRKNP